MEKAKVDNLGRLFHLILLAISASGLLYFLYFLLAPWIWSQNGVVDPTDVPSWSSGWSEGLDGVELYALYVMMFLNLVFAYFINDRLSSGFIKRHQKFLLIPSLVVSLLFLYTIGFHPPMSFSSNYPLNRTTSYTLVDIIFRAIKVSSVVFSFTAFFYFIQKYASRWMPWLVAFLLIPICFISTHPMAWYDAQFIFAPALQLVYGAKFAAIYFQYDILLSLLALVWMNLKLDLNNFQLIGQSSFYLLLLGLFLLSRNWFVDKRLPLFFLVALILVRIYAGPNDVAFILQVTPMRLDLWFVLLLLVYFKGPSHWSAGFFCGFILVFHKNFGLIYTGAYLQLLLTLSLLDASQLSGNILAKTRSVVSILFKKNYKSIVLIFIGLLTQYLVFKIGSVHQEASVSRPATLFTRISNNSFYWYMVPIVSLSFILLFQLRAKLSINYFAGVLFAIFIVIGNSLYFFGRSHENNIVNISAILLLLFFLMLDMLTQFLVNDVKGPAKNFVRIAKKKLVISLPISSSKNFISQNLVIIISVLFIITTSIWYGDCIVNKINIQASNFASRQFIYPSEVSVSAVNDILREVKFATNNSSKVYFLDTNSFIFNYYGEYAPIGYYNPILAWPSRGELNKFLQVLLDSGHYLVIEDSLLKSIKPFINFSNSKAVSGRLVVWN